MSDAHARIVIAASGLSIWRGEGSRKRSVVRELSLEVRAGERVALIGPNGAGKTSLLLACVGALPIQGRLTVAGHPLDRSTLERVRREVGFVFSDPQDQLFLASVQEEVAFGPLQRGVSGAELQARVDRALEHVGLSGFEQRTPSELSLGEQRRLAIATALSCEPSLVLLDEPTASLDPRARRRMIETLTQLEATVVCATHDLDAALDLGARVVLVAHGTLVADGPAAELLADPLLMNRAELELPLSLQGRPAQTR